jgi:hypothetical protein
MLNLKWKRISEKELAISVYFNSFGLQQVTFKISLHLIDTYRRKWLLCTLVAAVFNLKRLPVAHSTLQPIG